MEKMPNGGGHVKKQIENVKFPSRKYLLPMVALLIVLGLGAGVGIYFFLNTMIPVATSEDMYNAVRTTVAILGVITVGGAAAIQFRKQNFAEASAELDRDAKFSALLTKAIEHLGNDSIAIRKGAIYELRRLAVDSTKDRNSVVEILSGFVREGIEKKASPAPPEENKLRPGPDADIIIAAEILSFLYDEYKCRASLDRLRARHVELEQIQLRGASLQHAELSEAKLSGTDLSRADLTAADLMLANLRGANLRGVNLTGADLTRTDLTGAALARLDFLKSESPKPELAGVNFTGANLTRAFSGPHPSYTVDLLRWARIDETTKLDDELREEFIKCGKLKPAVPFKDPRPKP